MKTNHTLAVLCIIRTSRSKNDKVPVYLRITVDGQRAEISTKEYVGPSKWSSIKGRVKGNSEEVRGINKRLDTWETKVRDHYNNFLRDEIRIDAKLLKNSILGFLDNKSDFLEYFESYEKEVKSKVGIDFAPGTHKNYEATLHHLQNFIPIQCPGRIITLKDLKYDFIIKFETFLKLKCGNSNNGALKHIERVRKVIREAIKREDLTKDPFILYEAKKEKINRDYLTQEELSKIEHYETSKDNLVRIKDIFLFICYTGLTYQDLFELTPDDISLGIDGNQWISIIRNKTKTVVKVPLLPPALEIIEKYNNDPKRENDGKLLPVISNQKMNKYLKVIAEDCKIKKPVTCHIGRHTFATTVTLSNDIPIETVSKMLGHTKLSTTQIYAKVIEKKIGSDMNKLTSIYKRSDSGSDKAVNQ